MKLPYHFGRYTLIEKIANGGTAEVYRAVFGGEEGFAKTMAVKRLLPAWGGSDEMRQMLIDEARALVNLQHQAIVQVFELGQCEGSPFLAMEYVDGIDSERLLTEIIRAATPLPLIHAAYIMMQVLLALEFAHRSTGPDGEPLKLVHRDISPSNILLSWNGEVKVTDFGIAKGMHRTQETQAGMLRGKYAYMAPEQARGFPIDARADIFACGIVFYEILTAKRLFDAKTDAMVLEKVRDVIIPQKEVCALPPEIRAILVLSLAPDPERRYQCASEMLRDLRNFARSSGNAGSSLEFAEYLRERFPRASSVKPKGAGSVKKSLDGTKVMDSLVSGRRPSRVVKLVRAASLCACLFIMMPAHPPAKTAEGTAYSAPALVEAGQAQMERDRKTSPSRGGIVAIDSRPSGAKGKLIIGDNVREFTTPFSTDGIKMDGVIEGRVDISASGYEMESMSFKLSPGNPAFVKNFDLKKAAEPATLSVSARPWGLVYIAGYANGRETPVGGIKIKPGEYDVSVKYPPTGKTAAARVAFSGGESKHCMATFGKTAQIKCR